MWFLKNIIIPFVVTIIVIVFIGLPLLSGHIGRIASFYVNVEMSRMDPNVDLH